MFNKWSQGDSFKIKRGVRQGCPLSMILYIIAQEPMYQAIKKTQQIEPISIPSQQIKLLGYADDSTFSVKSDIGIIYIFTILHHFELASSIKLNRKKTKIIGFGGWHGRTDWPYNDIKVETSEIQILGITFASEIKCAVEKSWSNILDKIKQKIRILSQRYFTIFQRAIVINMIILAKVWYTSHTYPLPCKYSKLINTEIFKFLWQSKYNPIKRETLFQSKYEGGLGIFNVFYKAQSIYASTFLKQFLNSDENYSLMKYYCALRINPIFNILELPNNTSFTKSKFFDEYVILIRKLISVNNFPNISSTDIYRFLLPVCQPSVNLNINIDWKISWKCLNFKYVNVRDRDIIFKFLHGILTTKNRLFQIKKINSPLCSLCNQIENQLHMFVECEKIKNILVFFKEMLNKICNIENFDLVKMLHLNCKANKKQRNTAIILTTVYIGCVWYNRANTRSIEVQTYRASIIKHNHLLQLILGDNMKKLFTEKFCSVLENM